MFLDETIHRLMDVRDHASDPLESSRRLLQVSPLRARQVALESRRGAVAFMGRLNDGATATGCNGLWNGYPGLEKPRQHLLLETDVRFRIDRDLEHVRSVGVGFDQEVQILSRKSGQTGFQGPMP